MAPRQWWERGVRILARTCLEAVKDPQALSSRPCSSTWVDTLGSAPCDDVAHGRSLEKRNCQSMRGPTSQRAYAERGNPPAVLSRGFRLRASGTADSELPTVLTWSTA
jgi:hypothetical protein